MSKFHAVASGLLATALSLLIPVASAQIEVSVNDGGLYQGDSLVAGENYLARIGTDSPKELELALVRIEQLLMVDSDYSQYEPVVLVLHGPEVAVFMRDNYQQHKHLVDLAARLTAFGVIDIRVCETRLGLLGGEVDNLVPFVGTVPFGPTEINRLVADEGYLNF